MKRYWKIYLFLFLFCDIIFVDRVVNERCEKMKKEDMAKQMRLKIIESALQEFNEKSYEKASLNHICQNGNISKGIIYHYFKDKDDLYLECVQICFDKIMEHYKKRNDYDMQTYMHYRIQFFKEYPHLRGIFFNTILRTPQHLQKEVSAIKMDFNQLNIEVFKNVLNQVSLRENITYQTALEYYNIMQNSFNDYFRQKIEEGIGFDEIIHQHEELLLRWFDMMLYGIARKEE